MNHEPYSEDIGEHLGIESVETAVSKVEKYCEYEERRITLTNQPRIIALKYEGALLQDEERDLVERLRLAPPAGDLRSRRRKSIYYWGITVILTIAGFVFSLLAFDPYRLGWKSYVYCLGISIITPFLVETTIEKWKSERLFKSVTAIACLAALISLTLLATIRGDIFAEQMKNPVPVITFDNDVQTAPPVTNFYAATIPLLRLVMILLAIAMELGAGLALWEAWRMSSRVSEDWNQVRSRLATVRERIKSIIEELTRLEKEPAVFVARFWRNFYRGLVTHSVRSAMTKLLIFMIVVLVFTTPRANAEDHTTIVVAIDLTQSVAVRGPDKTSEFQKNIDGVSRLLAQVPVNSKVVVLGITDKSFAQPYFLLSASIPEDDGYFHERLNEARVQLVRTWKTRSVRLKPVFLNTDIIGALMISSQIVQDDPAAGKKALFIFSDMRHRTADLDLESVWGLRRASHRISKTPIAIPNLQGIQVHVLGVDAADRSVNDWQTLRQFWSTYIAKTGARLQEYSPFREVHLN